MKRLRAGNSAGLGFGTLLLLSFWVPLLLIGPKQIVKFAGDLIADPALPGGLPTACLLILFVLAVPFAGLALILWTVADMRRK